MSQLNDDDAMLLDRARGALATIELDGKIRRDRVDPIWRAIAADLLNDEDTARWARRIAQNVVRHVLDDKSQDRDDRALRALCLYGQGQRDELAERRLNEVLVFERLAGALELLRGNMKKSLTVKDRELNLLSAMRASGCYHGVSDQNAVKRLRRLMAKRAAG